MKIGMLIGGIATATAAMTIGQMNATALPGDSRGGDGGVAAGPDVIVGAIPDYSGYGSVVVGGQTIMAYAFGTTSCNIGTQQLSWIQGNNQHPVIPQNLYRIKNNVLEQIGMSWLKHGFCALQENLCGTCQPAGGGCEAALGIGCSDPYTSSLNGTQNLLGPRSQVNASTGAYPYPFSAPAAAATIGRRLQVNANDLNPAMNPGAMYFAECMYVHPQDAMGGNDNNNASYRRVNIGNLVGGSYQLSFNGPTAQQRCAIQAWATAVPAVKVSEVDTSDGRLVIGYTVTANGNGTWHYEYAIFNMNSDTSVGAVHIPIPAGVQVTNMGFHDVNSHSGEPFSTTDWTMSESGGQAHWSTETFATNANANALRWGTTYNFRFDASTGPATGPVSLTQFKNGANVNFNGYFPAAPALLGDLNNDGIIDGADLGILLGQWAADGTGDLNGDNLVDGADLGILLGGWS